jgi:hypothetical protein
MMRFLQEQDDEPNATQRRKNELINVQLTREKAFNNSQLHQDRIKKDFDMHTKDDDYLWKKNSSANIAHKEIIHSTFSTISLYCIAIIICICCCFLYRVYKKKLDLNVVDP